LSTSAEKSIVIQMVNQKIYIQVVVLLLNWNIFIQKFVWY